MKWTADKLDLLKMHLAQGQSYREISALTNWSYKSIEHAVTRYSLRKEVDDSSIFKKTKNKLKREDVDKLASIIGEHLYKNYKEVKIIEPKAIKCASKREETSVLDISDPHVGMINKVFDSDAGKQVVTYNMEIFKKELNELYNSIHNIHGILRNSYNLRKLVILFLGDIITNDRIFPEQTFEIEKVVGLQIWDAINYFSNFFVNLLNIYEEIEIVGVVGNHGRSLPNSYSEPVENNFEYFIYKMWEKQFADSKRINVIVPSTRRYVHKIYNWKHLLEHGCSMRGTSDTYIERQIKELSLNMGGFDIMHYGHFHKLKEREIADKVIVKQNGCWIPKDEYGFSKFKQYSVPKQFFFGCSQKRPETWGYKIDLRG